jgi:hypothetical protein
MFGCIAPKLLAAVCLVGLGQPDLFGAEQSTPISKVLRGDFEWAATPALVMPAERSSDPCYSVKDPSIVYFEGRWHLFCTIRSVKRSHQIEYLSFDNWQKADAAPRHVLALTNGYFCAPQVFFFEPQRKWYLIYQALDTNRPVALQPAFSITTELADPSSWTPPRFLFPRHPAGVRSWIDFWVICDEAKAHLFFTSNDGRMWRAETSLAQFPFGWSEPAVVLRADVFEASHTYRVKGTNRYLTIIESIGPGGRRYYKAYLADRLDGEWSPLATSLDKPFAAPINVRSPAWTDSFSHGELLRDGYDQRMEVDPATWKFLFQGVKDEARAGKPYGEIPWRLGLLEPIP